MHFAQIFSFLHFDDLVGDGSKPEGITRKIIIDSKDVEIGITQSLRVVGLERITLLVAFLSGEEVDAGLVLGLELLSLPRHLEPIDEPLQKSIRQGRDRPLPAHGSDPTGASRALPPA